MIIISPAKNLNLEKEKDINLESLPVFTTDSKKIANKLKLLDIQNIKSMMNISSSLATINFERFKVINSESNFKKAASFLFSGDTFNGLSVRSMKKNDLSYAQKNLRILSGLYGILKPLDLIEPYRLEMGTKTKSIIGKDLYDFWKNKITTHLNSEIRKNKSSFLFNLASKEYFSVIDLDKLDCKVISFDFKKIKNDEISGIGMMIKKLRGAMAHYIITNKVNDIKNLKKFNAFGFKFLNHDIYNNKLLFVSK